MDLYTTIIQLVGTKPDFNKCSKSAFWTDELTLLFHKEDLDWEYLSNEICINYYSLKFLSNHPELHHKYNWEYITDSLGSKKSFECPFIDGFVPGLYPDLPWNSTILTKNIIEDHYVNYRNCTACFRYITSLPHLPWDWKIASTYPYPDIIFIESHHHYDWDWKILSDKVSWTFILNHLDYEWDMDVLFTRIEDMITDEQDLIRGIYNIKTLGSGLSLPMSVQETLTRLVKENKF